MNTTVLIVDLVVMAGVTYLIRAVPLVLVRKKIRNRFISSFLFYIPYAVLAAMTIPAIFSCTQNVLSAIVGLVVALIVALCGKGLLVVALSACSAVYIVELIQRLIG